MDRNKLRVALGVISGRLDAENLSVREYERLGLDSYKFGYYGRPNRDEILDRAESVIEELLMPPTRDPLDDEDESHE